MFDPYDILKKCTFKKDFTYTIVNIDNINLIVTVQVYVVYKASSIT